MLKTFFLPNFPKALFGSAKNRAAEALSIHKKSFESKSLLEVGTLLGRFIPQDKIFAKTPQKAGSRERVYSTQVTFWAFFHQVLTRGMPCRDAVRKVQALRAAKGLKIPDESTSAYCRARSRLDNARLLEAHSHLAGLLDARAPSEELWQGKVVKMIDGTGLSMPDTTENQKEWPQNASQKPGCGFPQMKVVGSFSLAHGGLLAWTESDQFHHDSKAWRALWDTFEKGDVVLCDRGFNSYDAMALLSDRGVDSVMRIHQQRKVDFRRGTRLGKYDCIQILERPQRPSKSQVTPGEWKKLPDTLAVRIVRIHVKIPGFRTAKIDVITTLLDSEKYPANALRELYMRRWAIELYFRDIKISLGMDVLRCKTPDMVKKELSMHAIVYNMVRAIMQEASITNNVPLARLSFKGVVDTLREWSPVFCDSKPKMERQRLYSSMLSVVASDEVLERPARSEPRAKKRRGKSYQLMTLPRRKMRVSASRRKK